MKVIRVVLLILIITILAIPSMAWWDQDWDARSENNISDGNRPYQLRLNVSNATGTNNATHVFCNGNCAPNFTDIRFVLGETVVLPHWFENMSTGKVWVNVTANGLVYMYYDNSAATVGTSDGNSTFILFDDFSGTSLNTAKWTLEGSGTSSVSGGALYMNEKKISSKSTYSQGYFMRGRAKGGADTSNEWVIGFASLGYGEHQHSKISTPLEYDHSATYFRCINGIDNQIYKISLYSTVKDNSVWHIGEYRRGGTADTCILDDNQSINALYPSLNNRYLYADGHETDIYIDYLFMGNYHVSGPSWNTWSVEKTTAIEYIPPVPVLLGINESYFGLIKVEWTNGTGNITDTYRFCEPDLCEDYYRTTYFDTHRHGFINITVFAINFSNYTLSNPLQINYSINNTPPILDIIGNKIVYSNISLNFTIHATDSDPDTMTYGTNATKGSLNASTGEYIFNTTPADVGVYTWYFNVTDGYGGEDNETITVTVKAPRIISLSLYNTGWQIITVNRTQTMNELNILYSPAYIASWSSTSQIWQKYKSGWSYHQTLSVSKDQAAMILITSNKSVNVSISSPFSWILRTGHNLIGIPTNMTLSEINASVNVGVNCDNVDEIIYIFAHNMSERTYTCQNGAGQPNASVMVDEGRGVWLYALKSINMTDVIG